MLSSRQHWRTIKIPQWTQKSAFRGRAGRVIDIKESEESEIRDLSCGKSRGHVSGESSGKQINVLNKQSEKSELVIDLQSERARRTSEKMRERKGAWGNKRSQCKK